ncbi:MAG TPA: helix-turn-helix transcriptional regulator, partial [Agromyces sp.]
SAGSVYPTLQLLADEGLIEASELQGRKTYSLTDAGRDEAAASADKPAPWESPTVGGGAHRALSKAGVELAAAAAQVGRTGSPEQLQEAVTVLEEARRRLYSILADG